ncbi:MAG TPA: hypothetical protein VJX67_22300 [Blastocatellia bacterium]|nr:hypothetical protein [Blastocatellia bacterium]
MPVATVTPAGSVSVNPKPLKATVEFGLLIVNVRLVVWPSRMLAEPNALLIVGGEATASVAVLLVTPVPPFVDVIAPVVLFLTPAVIPVTFTTTVQVPLAAIVPALNVNVVSPAAGVNVPQPGTAPGTAATCNPDGSKSVNATPVRPTVEFGLVSVNVRLVVPPTGTLGAPNALLIVGGANTVRVAVLLAAPVPPLVDETKPVVLFLTPAVVPVTSTFTVHVPLGAMVPALNVKLVSPAPGVKVPQPGTAFGVAATCNPAGRASVNATPVSVVVVFGLVMTKVRVATPPFSGIVGTLKALLMAGAPTTVRVAVLLVAPAPLSFELIAPVVLFQTPVAAPTTGTPNEHVPDPARVPAVKLIVLGAVVEIVPPQVAVGPEVATVIPAGSVSVNAIPVNDRDVFGFDTVNVKVVPAPWRMLDAPNALLSVGGVATVSVADAVFPVPPLADVTAPLTLFFTPTVVPVTSTDTVHVPLAAILPPLNVKVVSPAAGVNVPQPGTAAGVEATCTPDGSASVNPTPLSASVEFGLVIVNVSVDVPFNAMLAGLNALLIDGADRTVIVAVLLAAPVPPSIELIVPVVLFLTPLVMAVTSTLTVHVLLAEIVPDEKVSVVSPKPGVNVPHPGTAFGVAATCTPVGSASVNATPVSVVVVLGFVIVNLSVAVPFSGSVVRVAVAVPPPDPASPVTPSVYVNVVAVGTLATVNVPL